MHDLEDQNHVSLRGSGRGSWLVSCFYSRQLSFHPPHRASTPRVAPGPPDCSERSCSPPSAPQPLARWYVLYSRPAWPHAAVSRTLMHERSRSRIPRAPLALVNPTPTSSHRHPYYQAPAARAMSSTAVSQRTFPTTLTLRMSLPAIPLPNPPPPSVRPPLPHSRFASFTRTSGSTRTPRSSARASPESRER